ncbi:haloacid dehalogenase, partial [Bifidobacteriaceae bacterium VN002]
LLNKVYEGIPEQLKKLRESGYYLATASCKPEYQVKPICDYFGLTDLIDGIYGASADMSRIKKDQVIRYVLKNIGFDYSLDKALMVGDRWTDADGALACYIDCLGCAWGYAEPGELKKHGAYRIIDNVCDLSIAIDEYFDNTLRK